MYKKLVRVLVVFMICAMSLSLLTACGSEAPEVEVPQTTSAQADVYLYDGILVDHNGTKRYDVAFDEHGNVMKDGKIFVASYNLAEFNVITVVTVVDEAELTQKIEASQEGENPIVTKPLGFTIRFAVEPLDSADANVTIESLDPGALYFPYKENADVISDERPENENMSTVTPRFDEHGQVCLALVGRFDGEFTLVAHDRFGNNIGEFVVILVPELEEPSEDEDADAEKKDSSDPGKTTAPIYDYEDPGYEEPDIQETTAHVHDFEDQIVEPTVRAQGYTIHTCKTCGLTYRDTFTERLECKHEYVTSTLYANCTEGGGILHTCSICGDSYKEITSSPLGHAELTWREAQPATCGANGLNEGICTRCGAVVSTETIPATGQHQYTTSTVPADCEHGGYTLHTCSVCGDSYTDGETEALEHTWEAHTETVSRQEAHQICAACGLDLTAAGLGGDAIFSHLDGHAQAGEGTDTYTQLVDISEERTVYTCTRCGATRTES